MINVYRAGLQAAFQIYIFSFKFKITHAEMEEKTIVVTLRWGYIEYRLVNILPKVAHLLYSQARYQSKFF